MLHAGRWLADMQQRHRFLAGMTEAERVEYRRQHIAKLRSLYETPKSECAVEVFGNTCSTQKIRNR